MKIPHFKTNINDEYHFKKISEHMEEYWKTHMIVPPHEDDPPYIVGRIIEIKENLTMKENSITITIVDKKLRSRCQRTQQLKLYLTSKVQQLQVLTFT